MKEGRKKRERLIDFLLHEFCDCNSLFLRDKEELFNFLFFFYVRSSSEKAKRKTRGGEAAAAATAASCKQG